MRRDLTRNLATAFDLDFAVTQRPGDAAVVPQDKPAADVERAIEIALNLRFLDFGRAQETAAGTQNKLSRRGVSVDDAFDTQRVAADDLALKLDAGAGI